MFHGSQAEFESLFRVSVQLEGADMADVSTAEHREAELRSIAAMHQCHFLGEAPPTS